jgi:vacuolar-type H+-ATPase catalytic subunit A/Vma1
MANNIPKSSNKPRESLRDIPDDLFERDASLDVKVKLVQKQYHRDPLKMAILIQRMINESK